MLISIIVPVYNAFEYLQRCFDSIVSQTYKNIQIILVDDESSDNRILPLLKQYTDDDNRILVVEKKNGGVTDARLKGLEYASGEYILFVDCDDYLTLDAVELLYDKAKETEADIVIGNYYEVYPKQNFTVERISRFQDNNVDDILKSMLTLECNRMIWGRLIRRKLFIINDIEIPLNISPKEDDIANFQLIRYTSSVVLLNKTIYYYMQRNDAVSRRMDDNALYSLVYAIKWSEEYFSKHFDYENLKDELSYYNLENWSWFLSSGGKCKDKQTEDLIYNKYFLNTWAKKRLSNNHRVIISVHRNTISKLFYNIYRNFLKPSLKKLFPEKYVQK